MALKHMKIYVVTYEGMYGHNGIECSFTTKEEALQYAIERDSYGCTYDYEEIELIQKEEEE